MKNYAVLDIETADAPETAVQDAIDAWKAPSNWKPETVERNREMAAERIRTKSALLDAAPIICIALDQAGDKFLFHWMEIDCKELQGWQVWKCSNEATMLEALRTVAKDFMDEETVIVGANHRNFDLPKLRARYIHHSLMLPKFLAWTLDRDERNRTADVQAMVKAFSAEHADDWRPRLDEVARVLGIPRPKQTITGADVPKLYAAGAYEAILAYCAIDTITTARAYELMTGIAADLA